VFRILTGKKIDALNKRTAPPLVAVAYGPKDTAGKEDTRFRGIGKPRDADQETPLTLKTVIDFYDTVHLGDSNPLKVFIFNTAKNAKDTEERIKDIIAKEPQKKFETENLYAKEQDPAKILIQFFAPYFAILPASRIVEVPAGGVAVSTHTVAPIIRDPSIGLNKIQNILISFGQVLSTNGTAKTIHLSSMDYYVNVEKSYLSIDKEKAINAQDKIRNIATIAGIATAILTGVSILITILINLGILII
jgi:hypothetical protein